jgi:ABC-type branched-subunit amino acid transport system ATPase component/ABC-type branched-subunit amino acid transport system permease subunit
MLDGSAPRRLGARVAAWAAGLALFSVVLTARWSVPSGIVVEGLILGSLTALLAFGLALVWRSNRIVNFAQADLGTVPASLCVVLVAAEGWSFWIAMPLALMLALALAWFVERVFIRWRFEQAPRLIVTVVTIGLASLLSGAALALPYFLEGTNAVLPDSLLQSQPFRLNLHIDPFVFHAFDLVAVVTTVVCAASLFVFLRRTGAGIALRAGAENPERAALLGVNVGRTHSVAWMISGVLAAVTMILRAGVFGLPLGAAFGPSILLRALAAAVIGRMENFAVIFVAACAIGVVEAAAQWNGATAYVDPLLLVLIVVALLLQRRRRESRVDAEVASAWIYAASPRPVPRELARLPEVRWTIRALRATVVAVIVLLPWVLDAHDTDLAAVVAIYGIVALSLVVLTGWAGRISLGQFGFVAVGAMVVGSLNVHYHWGAIPTLVLAGVAGAIVAVLVGLPALRVRGLMLAVTTLAFGVATSSYLLDRNLDFFGLSFHYLPDNLLDHITRYPPFGIESVLGLRVADRGELNETGMYLLCVAGLGLVVLAVRGLQLRRTARDLVATRENERAAQSFGLGPVRVELLAFAVAGFLASFAGGLYVLHQQSLGPELFLPIESIRVLTMVVVGGLTSIPGALLGAIFLQSTVWVSDSVPTAFRLALQLAGSGLGLVAVLMFLPGGLGGALYGVRDRLLRTAARRHGIGVAEDRAGGVADGSAGPTPADPHPGADGRDGSDVLLRVEAIDVAFGHVQVLFDTSLEVRAGETVALLGTNGAGKSTVLRAVSGLTAAGHGRVQYRGVDITGSAPHRIAERGLIHVPAGHGVFPSLTVAENLRIGGWLHRRDAASSRAATDDVLARFPILAGRVREPAANLSGGQQQMLAIAMALLARPVVLLVDELSLGLSPEAVDEVLALLAELCARGVAVLLVEQSITVALRVASRAYFMEKGRVRFEGATAELLARPDLVHSILLEHASPREEDHSQTPTAPPPRPRPSSVVLEARELTKRFAGLTAVDGLCLALHDGEILGLIGPNGAGKTTAFDLLCGYLTPDAGAVVLAGHDVTGLRPAARARLGLGRSFQDARLFGALTVHQAVCVALDDPLTLLDPFADAFGLPPRVHAEALLAARADELLDRMGVAPFRDALVYDLSTGTRRIVDLTCQIAADPRVILLDEPSAGIAQAEVEALARLLLDVRRTAGASLIVIEHDLAFVSSIADRVVALDLGAVLAEGDPGSVLADPRVVASYLGSARSVP